MENLVSPFLPDERFWSGKRVFLTGHTGFKGGWLAFWLEMLKARVRGYSLLPPSTPNLFTAAELETRLNHVHGDLLDFALLSRKMREFEPEVAFHLAAQPLVKRSYHDPQETFAVNVQGTVNFLQACRQTPSLRAIVIITTDKCYQNKEWVYPYREIDPLGGHDPYSASKACAEIVTSSFRSSFFSDTNSPGLASARAGNVIGGGDWGADRLIPDAARAFSTRQTLTLRRPEAIRPWQHVLDPLRGYLMLGKALYLEAKEFAGAYNFGPSTARIHKVGEVVEAFASLWGEGASIEKAALKEGVHEAGQLHLDSSLAWRKLGWVALADLDSCLADTAAWYAAYYANQGPQRLREIMSEQIGRLRVIPAGLDRRA